MDCEACLNNQCSTFTSSLNNAEADLADLLLKTLNSAGPAGIAKEAILVSGLNYILKRAYNVMMMIAVSGTLSRWI